MFGGDQRANPREGEVSERIDDEQVEAFGRIIDLLLAGGYFRARINGLSPFDKVVGGMAWSITASNVDIDVDVFFQENSTIGQKIKLSEKLIEAIQKMKCPYPLQAQQIQGLDYINLFPIIQWLIKKVIETREETGDLVRMYSESQFGKNYKMPQDAEFEAKLEVATVYSNELSNRYKPQRRYKRQKTSAPTLQATLLEYDKLNRMSRPVQDKKQQSSAAKKIEASLGGQSAEDEAALEEREIQDIMSTLSAVDADRKIAVGSFMSADQIQQIAAQNERRAAESGASGAGQKIMKEKQHKQKIAMLEKQIEQQRSAIVACKAEYEKFHQKVEEAQQTLAAKEAFNERIIVETQKLDALETSANAAQLQTLRGLVGLNDSLRAQEAQFKASCKKQMLQLKELISSLGKEQPEDEDAERRKLIEDTFGADSEKLKKIKQLAAKKIRDISLVERKIDEVPSRTELMQYQRQFVDLYEQVSARLIETRGYYNTYNTLEDMRAAVLAREVSILNSINDNHKAAMSSKSNRDKYLESMDNIVKSVIQGMEKQEAKLASEKKVCDELNQRYLKLVEKERNYYKATKEFQEECKKNERLLAEGAQ